MDIEELKDQCLTLGTNPEMLETIRQIFRIKQDLLYSKLLKAETKEEVWELKQQINTLDNFVKEIITYSNNRGD